MDERDIGNLTDEELRAEYKRLYIEDGSMQSWVDDAESKLEDARNRRNCVHNRLCALGYAIQRRAIRAVKDEAERENAS